MGKKVHHKRNNTKVVPDSVNNSYGYSITDYDQLHNFTIEFSDLRNDITLNHKIYEGDECTFKHLIKKWEHIELLIDTLLDSLYNIESTITTDNFMIDTVHRDMFQTLTQSQIIIQLTTIKLLNGIRKNNRNHMRLITMRELCDSLDKAHCDVYGDITSIGSMSTYFHMLVYYMSMMKSTVAQIANSIRKHKPTNPYLIKSQIYFREDLITCLFYACFLIEQCVLKINMSRQ